MKHLLTIFTLLLAINASFGLLFNVDNIKTRVYPGESLEYVINITNNEVMSKEVYINKFVVENTFRGSIIVKPSINLNLMPSESVFVNITVPVDSQVIKGVYQTPLILSYDNITSRVFLESVILSRFIEPVEFQNISLITPSSIKPLEPFNLTITLLCNVDSIYPSIRVIVSDESSIIFNASSMQGLLKGINIFNKEIKLPDKTPSNVYSVIVEAEVGGRVITQGNGSLLVEPYTIINSSSKTNEDLFGKSVSRVVANEGTEIINSSVNYTFSILEPMLVSKAIILIKKDGVTIDSIQPVVSDYVINQLVTLEPGESATLVINFNYGLLLAAPFIVILLIIGWFYLTKRVTINKEIIECKKEDGELMIKVAISVKNVSLSSINDVKIIEDLPVYAKKAGGFGSIKGELIPDKGVINFNAGRLDPKEELLVSYKFKTDVELIGRVSLPPATAKYKVNDKIQIIKSSTPIINLINGRQ